MLRAATSQLNNVSPNYPYLNARSAPAQALNIYKLNDWISKNKHWHLNALQSPPAVHFCFTAAHGPATADALVRDMRQAIDALKADPGCIEGGSAPMYGM